MIMVNKIGTIKDNINTETWKQLLNFLCLQLISLPCVATLFHYFKEPDELKKFPHVTYKAFCNGFKDVIQMCTNAFCWPFRILKKLSVFVWKKLCNAFVWPFRKLKDAGLFLWKRSECVVHTKLTELVAYANELQLLLYPKNNLSSILRKEEIEKLQKSLNIIKEDLEKHKESTNEHMRSLDEIQRKQSEKVCNIELKQKRLEEQVDQEKQKQAQGLGKKVILILCVNDKYISAAASAIYKLKQEDHRLNNFTIMEHKLTGVLDFSHEQLQGASKVILIAVPEPRGLIISDSEPSQLGACYRTASAANCGVFLVYMSDKLPKIAKGHLYHSSVDSLLSAQATVGHLASKKRFASLRFKVDSVPKLNSAQAMAITDWLLHQP